VLITQLETLISRYTNTASLPANQREAERRRILSDFYRLRPYSDVEASGAERRWGESTSCSRTGSTIIDDGGVGGNTGSGNDPIFPNVPNPPTTEPVATST
jgi:hypothetical protein